MICPASFRYAAQGLGYAFLTQRNFRIHVVLGLVVFGLAAWLQLDLIRLAVLVLTVAAVFVLELLNTAMEAVVDLAIGRRYHPLARIAKDCAAAAVLTAAISSLLIALFLILPPLVAPPGALTPDSQMLLVIDNYDSFTFNLVQYFGELAAQHPLAADLQVHRNDAISLEQIRDLKPDAILLSPGPGDPDQSGVCLDILKELSATVPTLGVCLGHQAIAQVFGGRVVRAQQQMHGKTSPVLHKGDGVFAGLPQPLTATRYHSLIAERDTLPDCLEVTAWLDDGTIMGLRHREHHHLQGVQFHPESVLTDQGHQLLANFLREAEG